MTKKLLNFVGITSIPNKSFEMSCLRILAELNLPLTLVKYLHQLFQNGPGSLKEAFSDGWNFKSNRGTRKIRLNQELAIIASCVVILKVVFGLDGKREKKMSKAAKLANNGLKRFFVWEEWFNYARLRLNFMKNVYPAQFKSNDTKPSIAIDVELFHRQYWNHTSSFKELETQHIYFQKAKVFSDKSDGEDSSTSGQGRKRRRKYVSSDTEGSTKGLAFDSDTSTVSLRKRSKKATNVEINANLRKIISLLNQDDSEVNCLSSNATSFPSTCMLRHSFLDDNPDSCLKENFSHREILVGKNLDLPKRKRGFWRQKHEVRWTSFSFKEYYEKLPFSFKIINDLIMLTFNILPIELSEEIYKIEQIIENNNK